VALAEPVADLITRIEGDQPLLSDLLPAWNSLITHAESWSEKHGRSSALARGVLDAFNKRPMPLLDSRY
jgi:hypothetical protein